MRTRLKLTIVWQLSLWFWSRVILGASPGPVVIPPSEYFEGNDGPWSTFDLRVGTEEQHVRVLISTASPETLVVLSEYGCSTEVFSTVPSDCASSRGMMFTPNASSTWQDVGVFEINDGTVGFEANLDYVQRAEFGLDTLGIGLVAGDNGPTLENQTIGCIATASPFYLGIFGLSTQPVNFTTLGNSSSSSYLTSLKSANMIPSLSWSYTAGAIYRLKKVYGQLIFSGYDTSRFISNAVSFTMADDVTRDLVVALQSISYSGSTEKSLLKDPINIFIDSTDPFLWLPSVVCDAFEDAFGLILDEPSGLYLVNESQHALLEASNAQVSFYLSDILDGGSTVTIVLPYEAFDLTAESPLVENSTRYFPLKRAANESQYTLGRTFLQEAYLTADYEHGRFNVSQCAWNEGATENIVPILSKDASSDNDTGSESTTSSSPGITTASTEPDAHHNSNGGVIAGIVIGIAALFSLVGVVVLLVLRKRKTTNSPAPEPTETALTEIGPSNLTSITPELSGEAMDTDKVLEILGKTHGELSEESQIYQLDGTPKASVYELPVSRASTRNSTEDTSRAFGPYYLTN